MEIEKAQLIICSLDVSDALKNWILKLEPGLQVNMLMTPTMIYHPLIG